MRSISGSFWTPQRSEQLQRLRREGLSTGKIAERLGTTPGIVIGRLHRLTGTLFTFPSYIRNLEKSRARTAARRKVRTRLQRAAIKKMQQEIARGLERNRAIARARKAGATLQAIGDALGLTRERVRQIEAEEKGG
jgi:hypothetical protein